MARQARGNTEGHTYHIFNRRILGLKLFRDDMDFYFFCELLRKHSNECKVIIHEYVVMENHFHMLVTPQEKDSLSNMMHRVCMVYARYFNRKYECRGHVFESRYYAKEVTSKEYFEMVATYIINNPVKAGLVKVPSEWRDSSRGKRGHIDNVRVLQKYNPRLRILSPITQRKEYQNLPAKLREKYYLVKR